MMQEFETTQRTHKRQRALLMVVIHCLLAVSLLVLGACGQTSPALESQGSGTESSAAAESGSYTFTDDLGNEITVDSPERVIACMGSFANIWELSGGELIGITEDALDGYIDETAGLPTVGDFTAPNLEEIIALEPDFVIMTGATTGRDGSASQVELQQSLEASGITVAYFNVTVFEDYLRMLEICCAINDRPDLYEANGEAVKAQIDAVIALAAEDTNAAPTVLLMTTYSGGTRVQNSSTMTGAMLADLGVTNLADENSSLLKEFSLEAVIEMNPDYILVVPMGNDDAAALKNLEEATAANPAWATLDAVQNNRYITLEKELFLYKPNALWAESYQALYDILYV